jgi:hypothetical protein
MTDLATDILIRRLAQSDAPWLPLRRADWRNAGAIWHARQPDAAAAPLYAGAADGAERMRYSRAHAALVRDGLMTSGKPAVAKLTARGVRVARGLSWQSTAAELREALNRLAARVAAGDCLENPPGYPAGRYVPEPFIAGVPWGGDTLPFGVLSVVLSVVLLPALRAGLVDSASSAQGHVCYSLPHGPVTDKQLAALVDADLADTFDEDAADVWREQHKASRQQILDADAGGELGFIPLHVGILRSGRRYDELAGIPPLFPYLSAPMPEPKPTPTPEPDAAAVDRGKAWLAATANVDPATYRGWNPNAPAVAASSM